MTTLFRRSLLVALLGLGVWMPTIASTPARPACPSDQGACFIPIAEPPDTLTFALLDGTTGWAVFVTYSSANDFFQARPNGYARVHISDQDATLTALNIFTGEQEVGTGRASVDDFFDPVTGASTCPAIVTVAGDVGAMQINAKFHTVRGNPGGNSPRF